MTLEYEPRRELDRATRGEARVMPALVILTSLLAAAMVWLNLASAIEGISFVTGAICVWLTVKENVWNFPIGLLNVATFVVVFWRAELYGDAGLQVVYFVLGLIGWYLWLYGGERRTALKVERAGPVELAVVSLACIASAFALWWVLYHHTGGVAVWDAVTTALSLGAQWLLNRKKLESWIGWIVVDVIYVPLYLYKGLYLTAILYAVFLCMAVMGFMHWRRTYRARLAAGAVA
jgi:nicotinamide mononucleotide transporter